MRHLTLAAPLAALVLAGCGTTVDRLRDVGKEPALTTIQNPTRSPAYHSVSMPMPEPASAAHQPNSLWQTGARGFFKDQRAARVGDILTVLIEISDKAQISNTTKRSRANEESAALPSLLGFETKLSKVLPDAIDPNSLADVSSGSSSEGAGSVKRDEKIDMKVAAVITQRLPNGNFVVHGRQEVRVNFEVRELQIAGVIRPEDIGSDNTISYEKIAEARISYGGRGQITDVQQPRYGQQVFDILFPF